MERAVMRHSLAEGAVHRIVIQRCFALRVVENFDDGRRGGAVDVGLGDVGLQAKSDQDQAGDKAPARISPSRQLSSSLHLDPALP